MKRIVMGLALAACALLVVPVVLLAGSVSAQSQDMKAMAQQFGQSAKQNAMALRMCTSAGGFALRSRSKETPNRCKK